MCKLFHLLDWLVGLLDWLVDALFDCGVLD